MSDYKKFVESGLAPESEPRSRHLEEGMSELKGAFEKIGSAAVAAEDRGELAFKEALAGHDIEKHPWLKKLSQKDRAVVLAFARHVNNPVTSKEIFKELGFELGYVQLTAINTRLRNLAIHYKIRSIEAPDSHVQWDDKKYETVK